MTDQQITTSVDRTERAAQSLAIFEHSDAFTSPIDTAEREAARTRYRHRAAGLLARAGTPSSTGRRRITPPVRTDDAVLALSFDQIITAETLAALTPEEITELFGALHTVASIAQKPTGGTA